MKNNVRTSCVLLIFVLLVSCSDDEPAAQVAVPEQTVETHNHNSQSEFTPEYISAEDLNQRFRQSTIPFIFDVRDITSFQQSHIETALSMPYGQTEDSDLAAVVLMGKDSEIVTYCGCPRHLSTLSAEDLTKRGYNNVKVLYEGYWHWKDKQFPTFEVSTDTATTVLKFEGVVSSQRSPVPDLDLFLRHEQSGQLEAVRTDRYGKFDLEFHLYKFRNEDQFNLIVADLSNQPSLEIRAAPDETTFIELNL